MSASRISPVRGSCTCGPEAFSVVDGSQRITEYRASSGLQSGSFAGASRGFVLAYVFVRLMLLALYVRAIRHVEQGRAIATFYFVVFSAAMIVWLGSLLFPAPARYWIWALALAIELPAPIVGWRLIPSAPVDPMHAPERLGLLTIIVLG